MTFLETVSATVAYRDHCEDRVAALEEEQRTVIVVADGAGGTGSGDVAAETVAREVEAAYPRVHSADEWCALLEQIDCRVGVGESTAAVVDVRPYGIAGASVGDSQAWIVHDGAITDLTEGQHRKPLLGSGSAVPVAFIHPPLQGVLLVGTDGFFNYVKRGAVPPMVAQSDFCSIPRTCIQMVRLPSCELWDDVGIVAARVRPRQRSAKRYAI